MKVFQVFLFVSAEGVTHIDAKGDGRHFISNGKDQAVKLWDMRRSHSQMDLVHGVASMRGLPRYQWCGAIRIPHVHLHNDAIDITLWTVTPFTANGPKCQRAYSCMPLAWWKGSRFSLNHLP